MRIPHSLLVVAAATGVAACTESPPVTPRIAPQSTAVSVLDPDPGPCTTLIKGRIGPGSLYGLCIPQNWNGEAIYFAHGIRPPQAPIDLGEDQDNFIAVRNALGTLGYAIAYSSFSENGWAVKDAAQRTHQLRSLLAAAAHAQPTRNYLMGYSLGGLVSLSLVEQFPNQYDGLLAMCGMVGGSLRELQYVGDVRALFDFFYPGVLAGDVITPPAVVPTLSQVQALVAAALLANPPSSLFGMYAIASTSQAPLAFLPVGDLTNPSSVAFQTLVQSLVVGLYYQQIGTQDVLDRTHGHSPYTNRGVTYTLGTPVIPALTSQLGSLIAAANAGVKRYDRPPDALNYLQHYYVPSGNLEIPVVTGHNHYDYLVPYFHEPALHHIVASAGSLDMLFQPPPVENYGHCNFSTSLLVNYFQTLVTWVKTGVKPTS